jgi:hypothetical protein
MHETARKQTTDEREADKTPVRIIACRVPQDALEPLLPEDLAEDIILQDYGLHRVPDKVMRTLQRRIDDVNEPSLIVLGYGLCGNGAQGVKSRQHTLLIPRTDDCIAILLGSRRAYRRESNAVPGTYYLSKGWLELGSHPVSEYEEYTETYGREEAEWIPDQQYQHYKRVALAAHSGPALEACALATREVARFCERWEMRYEEILDSDDYVRRLVDAAVALHDDGLAARDRIERDFVIVPPGEEVRTSAFVTGV